MCDCDHDHQNSSGFIFGIFLGAIIGAVVAIYIYKNNQTDIFENLKSKLAKYFQDFTAPSKPQKSKKIKSSKISVSIPSKVESLDLTPPKISKPQKMFKK
ncbi:MAG: hypothetical protein WAV41_05930 [Microgenomates group bacterium]